MKEILKTFFLFLFCFYSLYILIDYANHSKNFLVNDQFTPWQAFILYYTSEFINRSEVLIPLAILLGTIRTLCRLNDNNELIAMMASGVKISTLLRPFLFLAIFFTAFMYLNAEYLIPPAANQLNILDDAHSGTKKRKAKAVATEHLLLKDHSTLLFQKYDPGLKQFIDVYWIRSIDAIYKMKSLSLQKEFPTGFAVDYIVRNEAGHLVVIDSKDELSLPDFHFDKDRLKDTLAQPDDLSLSTLWAQLPDSHEAQSEKEARLVSAFHRKLALPWLCLLAVIAPAPFCLRFSRQFPTFLVYASSLFGLIAIYIVLDAAHVLGRRQLMDPLFALWTPLVAFLLLFGWRYVKIK